jgi:hypothetical protein
MPRSLLSIRNESRQAPMDLPPFGGRGARVHAGRKQRMGERDRLAVEVNNPRLASRHQTSVCILSDRGHKQRKRRLRSRRGDQ